MGNVLVVDDNQSDLILAKALVTKAGYQAITCQDSLQALEYVGSYPLDLIIIDWSMPQLNGLEFLKRIKSVLVKTNIPVMFMSGKNEVRDIKTAIQAGANDYLIKPVDPLAFESKIKKVIGDSKKEEYSSVANGHAASKIEVGFEFKLLKMSDYHIQFESPFSAAVGQTCKFDLSLVTPCSLKDVSLTVDAVEQIPKGFLITAKFNNLDEVLLKKIRMIRATMGPVKAA